MKKEYRAEGDVVFITEELKTCELNVRRHHRRVWSIDTTDQSHISVHVVHETQTPLVKQMVRHTVLCAAVYRHCMDQ